jgi:glycerol-3-phosphate dehydrogenase (NAD(P)+)
VTLWSALPEELDSLGREGRHKNLPGARIAEGIKYDGDIKSAISGCEACLFAVASGYIRSTARLAAPHLSGGAILISAAKGIEADTLHTMSEVIAEEVREHNPSLEFSVVALSGPTHAEEVALGLPTSIVSACEDEEISRRVAEAFSSGCMRVYTNTDILGVEISGALKNIIALAAGINKGMGFGDNAQAMLITRGIAEITRMGLALGCKRRTFMGLAGIGDLIVTCTSRHSRNNRCGELIGQGMSYDEASEKIGMVVEGYHALKAALELSDKYGVEMPITRGVDSVINKNESPFSVIRRLMLRDVKDELTV